MELSFDLNELTLGDVEDIEEITGVSYSDIEWTKPSIKLMKAMVLVSERRKNPAFTIDDARGVKITEIRVAESNPTDGGDAS